MRGWRMFAVLVLAPLLAACGGEDAMELSAEAAVNGAIPAPSSVEAPPARAERSESGLAWVVLREGDGETIPGRDDLVRAHYTGWQTDGRMFDSSVMGGEPATFPVGGVIRGWVEALQLMSEGEERRLWIPADLAYGETPQGGRPGGMLVFDVKLVEVVRAAPGETPQP